MQVAYDCSLDFCELEEDLYKCSEWSIGFNRRNDVLGNIPNWHGDRSAKAHGQAFVENVAPQKTGS